MPDLLDEVLENDTCVYWAPTDVIGPDGRPVLDSPVELGCFWQDKAEQYMKTGNSEIQVSKSVVIVSDDVQIQGALWHGSFNTLLDLNDAYANRGALEIQAISKLPADIEQDEWLRMAYL